MAIDRQTEFSMGAVVPNKCYCSKSLVACLVTESNGKVLKKFGVLTDEHRKFSEMPDGYHKTASVV